MRWNKLFWIFLIIVVLGFIYWRTLLPGVGYWGDMAKFQFLGKILGTPHLSGYPTYIMLNAIFIRLMPIGSLAFRVNLLSAIFGILAVCFVFLSLVEIGVRNWLAFVAALSFGFSYSLWEFSLVAEVYTLTCLFVSVVIFLLIKWHSTNDELFFYGACLVYAFSFGNHLTIISLLPAFIFMIWVTNRQILVNPRKLLFIALIILAGFAQYGYILWRSLDPSVQFLETNTQMLIDFFLKPWKSPSSFHMSIIQVLSQQVPSFLGYVWREYFLILLISVWGMLNLKDKRVNLFLLWILVGNIVFALNFEVRETWVYFLPAYLVLAIYLGVAMEDLTRRFLRKPFLQTAWIVLPLALLYFHYPELDQSKHVLHAQIVEKALTAAERDAFILTDEYDYANFFWYYLLGEEYFKKNLYSLSLEMLGTGPIKDYLENRGAIYDPFIKMNVPAGLKVYALWRLVEPLEEAGFILKPTQVKYLYEVQLK